MNKAYLALDYGTKKTWLAYSVGSFVFGHKTVPTSELHLHIEKLVKEKHITDIVIGMPYNIDGTISKHGKRVEQFAGEVEKKISLPIHLHDERLTSSEARITFDETGFDGDIDIESARLILEDFLKLEK